VEVSPCGDTSTFFQTPAKFDQPTGGFTIGIHSKPTWDNFYMAHGLKRTYFTLLLPAVAGFILIFALRHFHLASFTIPQIQTVLNPIIFVASVCFAVAFPILYRTVFANKRRHQTHTAEEDWLKFERNLLYIAMATPYIALIAQILQLPRFPLAGTIIMALYAVYYYYPSKRRIAFERRIFRVKA
jgi:hypothetical protein